MSKTKKSEDGRKVIALNKKASHDYFIEQRFEAGVVLQGWEVKSLREGRAQIAESYVVIKKGEIWLLGATITPLLSASTHINPDPQRTRKLLLKHSEISKLIGLVERKGYTLIPFVLYWKNSRIKLEVALARGKKEHDKRAAIKDRDWQRSKERLMRK